MFASNSGGKAAFLWDKGSAREQAIFLGRYGIHSDGSISS